MVYYVHSHSQFKQIKNTNLYFNINSTLECFYYIDINESSIFVLASKQQSQPSIIDDNLHDQCIPRLIISLNTFPLYF